VLLLQLVLAMLHPVLLLLLLGQLLLLQVQRLLLLVSTHQLLTLVLLELDLLLPLLLRLPDQAVLFQLGNKINNYFPSRLANFRIQIRFSLNSP
jgi:hypothetical protein